MRSAHCRGGGAKGAAVAYISIWACHPTGCQGGGILYLSEHNLKGGKGRKGGNKAKNGRGGGRGYRGGQEVKDEDVISVFTRIQREQRGGDEMVAFPPVMSRKQYKRLRKQQALEKAGNFNAWQLEGHEKPIANTSKPAIELPDGILDPTAMVVGSREHLMKLAGAAVVWRPGLALKVVADDDHEQCNICFIDAIGVAPSVLLSCGHVVHYSCIRQYIQKGYVRYWEMGSRNIPFHHHKFTHAHLYNISHSLILTPI